MRKITIQFLLFFSANFILAQVEKNIYELNEMENLLNQEVLKVIDNNLIDKKVVFLGEAEHHIGSDFLAKTKFVKHLVTEKGFKDIAFEADFFGLYFHHNKENLYLFWSNSVQCKELFEFLKEHNVTIWGIDNQMSSHYTYKNFTNRLMDFLNENSIGYDDNFSLITETFIKNRNETNKVLNRTQIDYLLNEVTQLLRNEKVIKNRLWFQIIENLKSDMLINTTDKNKKKGIPIRDSQMAKNLDFLIKTMPDKKFIIWLANAHMAKHEYAFMKGQTMGSQFVTMNPEISYHIAVSSINMPYRKSTWIEKCSNDNENLLHFLPSTKKNYFIDSKQIIRENPEYAEKEYMGMFGLEKNKTNWFKHFDALVFISQGEKVKYLE